MASIAPLSFEYRPPRGLGLLLVLALGLAAAAVAAAAAPPVLALAAGLALLANAWHCRLRLFPRGGDRVGRLVITGPANIVLELADGRRRTATLADWSTILPGLVVLGLHVDGGTDRTLVVTAGAVGPQTLRRLRVRLRLG